MYMCSTLFSRVKYSFIQYLLNVRNKISRNVTTKMLYVYVLMFEKNVMSVKDFLFLFVNVIYFCGCLECSERNVTKMCMCLLVGVFMSILMLRTKYNEKTCICLLLSVLNEKIMSYGNITKCHDQGLYIYRC